MNFDQYLEEGEVIINGMADTRGFLSILNDTFFINIFTRSINSVPYSFSVFNKKKGWLKDKEQWREHLKEKNWFIPEKEDAFDQMFTFLEINMEKCPQ